MSEIRIVDRDIRIFGELERWRVVLGRHVVDIAGFTGIKSCQRRLRKLIKKNFLSRQRILYGVPSIYTNTHKAKLVANLPKKTSKIRIEQIHHDIAVLDTAIYFHKMKAIPFSDMVTEKQLHSMDGFGIRKHRPDFVINRNGKKYCVEIELSLKAKSRLENIIKENYTDYDRQIWIVPDKQCKIYRILKDNQLKYENNIRILELQEVQIKNESNNSSEYGAE